MFLFENGVKRSVDRVVGIRAVLPGGTAEEEGCRGFLSPGDSLSKEGIGRVSFFSFLLNF